MCPFCKHISVKFSLHNSEMVSISRLKERDICCIMLRWFQTGRRCIASVAKYSTSSWTSKIVVHTEVSEALLKNKPVIALESTIITHGMPFPQNLK